MFNHIQTQTFQTSLFLSWLNWTWKVLHICQTEGAKTWHHHSELPWTSYHQTSTNQMKQQAFYLHMQIIGFLSSCIHCCNLIKLNLLHLGTTSWLGCHQLKPKYHPKPTSTESIYPFYKRLDLLILCFLEKSALLEHRYFSIKYKTIDSQLSHRFLQPITRILSFLYLSWHLLAGPTLSQQILHLYK